ncbi:MAG: MFS transporter [Pseudomonadota bacterium]
MRMITVPLAILRALFITTPRAIPALLNGTASIKEKRMSVLVMSTFGFFMCFAVWMMFGIMRITIQDEFGLSNTQTGLLVATPVFLGSVSRIFLGTLVDRAGGRKVYTLLIFFSTIPIFAASLAQEYWQLLVAGALLGIVGGSFVVGIVYVCHWFPTHFRATAMGIFGAGNMGAIATNFFGPWVIQEWGWRMIPKIYAIAMIITGALFYLFTFTDKNHMGARGKSLREQLSVLTLWKTWRLSQYYSFMFGAFVALALWMPGYYQKEFGLTPAVAAMFALAYGAPGGGARAIGGWLSDKFGPWAITWFSALGSLVCLTILSYPAFSISIPTFDDRGPFIINYVPNIWVFTTSLIGLGLFMSFGKGSVYGTIGVDPDFTHENMGVVMGMVGLVGGLGGFFLPIMFGALEDFFGVRSVDFMLLWGCVLFTIICIVFFDWRSKKNEHIEFLRRKNQGDRIEGELVSDDA